MKFIEKISLILFSTVMLILSVLNCLLIFGWLKLGDVNIFISKLLSDSVSSNIILGVSVVFILLAIKNIFFDSTSKESNSSNILLQNENGKLMISEETLENLVVGIAKQFEETENVTTKVYLDREDNLKVYVNLYVSSNAVIKDISAKLQLKIKEAIKKTADLDVKEVNIKIRNLSTELKK